MPCRAGIIGFTIEIGGSVSFSGSSQAPQLMCC